MNGTVFVYILLFRCGNILYIYILAPEFDFDMSNQDIV